MSLKDDEKQGKKELTNEASPVSDLEREFWERVFLKTMSATHGGNEAYADACAAEWRARFKKAVK